jgi:hypothetical protein
MEYFVVEWKTEDRNALPCPTSENSSHTDMLSADWSRRPVARRSHHTTERFLFRLALHSAASHSASDSASSARLPSLTMSSIRIFPSVHQNIYSLRFKI